MLYFLRKRAYFKGDILEREITFARVCIPLTRQFLYASFRSKKINRQCISERH